MFESRILDQHIRAEDQSGKRPAWNIPSAKVDDTVVHGHMVNTGLSIGRRTICRVHDMCT